MNAWPHFVAWLGVALTVPGTLLLGVLTLAGVMAPRGSCRARRQPIRRLATVVPAHNEEALIARTVASLAADADAGVEIVVVADNCTDQTAALARAAGARVLERHDHERRGKGYALDFAFARLLGEGFDGFVVVDADSTVRRGFFAALRDALESGADAVQAVYLPLCDQSDARARLVRVALFAWNVLRLRGRDRLGLSVGILGNGFALRRDTLLAVPYAARSIVEDLEYHLALVGAGKKVRFCAAAVVEGEMPIAGEALATQRARWEGGRLAVLADRFGGLAREIMRGRLRLLEPLADLMTFPLAYHVACLGIAALGSGLPRTYALLAGAIVVAHVAVATWLGGGGWRDVGALSMAPIYIIRKALGLRRVLAAARKGTPWVRTSREKTS